MEGVTAKETTSPIKETKTVIDEVEHVHNGKTVEEKTKTPEKISNGDSAEKTTPEQGTKRKIETECEDEIKKVKSTTDDHGDEDKKAVKEHTESDEPLKPAKKVDSEEIVSESTTPQEAC